jgi:hypothetical protein
VYSWARIYDWAGVAHAIAHPNFFAGLTMPEAADALGVSLATVENDWAYAKSWLRLQIGDSPLPPSPPGRGPG